MDYWTTVKFRGNKFEERRDHITSKNVWYHYFDFKAGVEFIIKEKIRIQAFPMQLGYFYNVKNNDTPIYNVAAIWKEGIRPGVTIHYILGAQK
ncbi:MAG: hypothetical protein ACI8SE_000284 [Bacteroidia bacterium]|jgi:hypothetical protein